MPAPRSAPGDAAEKLRAYAFHGTHLAASGTHAVGDCPFCGREGKLSVEVATGVGKCWSCGSGSQAGGFNPLAFTRLVYDHAAGANVGARRAFLGRAAADRRLGPDALAAWGVVPAADGAWLVPGYSTEGRLDQVYRRTRILDRGEWVWRLLPTPNIWPEGQGHALHLPVEDFDPQCRDVYICEGPWDGMALWEAAQGTELVPCQVLAVPGCSVWRDEWTEFCRGKDVCLLYDSDHPKQVVAGRTARAGYDGMVRVARRLSGVAASVRWLRWGPDGYDPDRPSGWDVRDHLTQSDHRAANLEDLFLKVEDAPREWFNPAAVAVNGHAHHGSVEAVPCQTWAECEGAWHGALRWRDELSDALAVLMAVCTSTQQAGNQLFLDLIGSPGSAKTTLCRALLVSNTCIHLENATKLISGYKKPGDASKDCSFLARANGKTWVTCEFDVLASSPQYRDLMGKVRRIFDGETSATYGNSDEDRVYQALRTPWIRAGTLKMVDHDQSQLGDRFLRFQLTDPDNEERRAISRRAIQSERAALLERANATSCSVLDAETRRAYALTGGYVDWLRANAEGELLRVEVSEAAEDACIDLAELSADLRARPTWEHRHQTAPSESNDFKELPTRLARQFVRLATCLAVVLNRTAVDDDVLRIVSRVALDTAAGHSLKVVQWLCSPNPKDEGDRSYQECGGLVTRVLEMWTTMTPERLHRYLTFLRKIGVVDWRQASHSEGAWVLTDRVYDLYLRVVRRSVRC